MSTVAPARIGRYEVISELGRGPASIVHRANDPQIERIVAIKVYDLHLVAEEDESCRASILQRVQAASTLSHSGILKIFDVGAEEQTGAPYIVSEFAPGTSLEQMIADGEEFTKEKAFAIATELLDALSHAHSHGVPHLNLKPSNVVVDPDGHIKISDFGGVRLGKASTFVSPEQLQGSGDCRSDLFSIGVILYLLLSGHRPFQGSTDATISFKLVHQHPVPVAALNFDLTPEVDEFIGRLLAKNPGDRFQTADAARLELARVQEVVGSDTTSRTSVPLVRSPKHAPNVAVLPLISRFSSWKLGLISVTMLLGVVSAGVIRRAYSPVPPPPKLSLHISVPEGALIRPVARVVIPTVRNVRSRPQGDSPAAQTVAVPVEVLHPFAQFGLSIWIDDRLAYNNEIRGERKKRFLHLGSSPTPYLSVLQTSVGKHVLRVRVTAGATFDQTAIVAGLFSSPGGQKLQIKCETPDKLQATVN